MRFEGLSAFPITPADAAGHVDTAGLRRLLSRLAGAGVDGIGLLGSTGAAPFFPRAERHRAVDAALQEVGGRVPVMVGIGALRTSKAVDLGRDAAACGADAVLLQPVSYTPLTEEEVYRHMATVAEAVGLPLCLYNNPGTTHFTFSAALIGRLSRVAPIAAVKNPAPEPAAMADELKMLRDLVPAGFSVGASIDARGAAALLAGYDAWYSVLSGVLPELCVPIAQAAKAGDADRVRCLNAALAPLWDVFSAYSSFRVVHAIAASLGISHAAPPLPVQGLDDAAQRQLAAALASLAIAV